MMRRSAGMGGGGMLRAMGHAMGARIGGVKETFSTGGGAGAGAKISNSLRNVVSISSSPSFLSSSSTSSSCSLPCFIDEEEWERIDGDYGGGDEIAGADGFADDRFVFGPAPSREEVEEAVSTIQQIFVPVTFSRDTEIEYPSSLDGEVVDEIVTPTDWIEPPMHLHTSKASLSYEQEKVLDTFRSLQVNPSIQKMVVSLSCDKAVWDAVMNNEVVQEYKKSLNEVQSSELGVSEEGDDNNAGILRWIIESTKGKLMEFFGKISKVVREMFQSKEDKDSEPVDDFVKSSFMLSIVVFIIVVVTRAQRA